MYSAKLYFKFFPNSLFLGLSLFSNLLLWVWLLVNLPPQTEPIFLHFNILFGVDYVGPWWRIIFVPLTGLLIIFFNGLLGWWLSTKDKYFGYLLNLASVLAQIILLIAGYILVLLNV